MAKKLYFKIGEACKKLGIQPYVLRYWETEFPFLNPDKSKSGQRVYSKDELEVIGRIKDLLYEEGYTIAGAKKKLEAELNADPANEPEGGGGKEAGETAKKSASKTSKGAKKATQADAADGASTAASTSEPAVDPATSDQLERLRDGVSGALQQAREILDRLGSVAP